MFAFVSMSWWQVALAVLAVGFLLRVSRRGRACGRHGVPWKTAAFVVLGVLAVKHFGAPKFSWTFDDEVARFVHGHAVNQGFPPVKQQDLWALRRAEGKQKQADSREMRAGEVQRRVAEVEARAGEVAAHAAKVASRNERGPDAAADDPVDAAFDATIEALAASPHIPADVVMKVAAARDLAHRAIDEGKAIYARTKRDAKALAVMARMKSEKSDAAEPLPAASHPAPPPDVPVGPASELATAVAPSAPAAPPAAPIVAAPAPAALATQESHVSSSVSAATPRQAKSKDGKRPKWVDEPPGREGDIYYTSVTVGPHKDVQGCEEELPTELERAVNAYIDNYLGPGASKTFQVPQAFIQDRIVKHPYYVETRDFGETDPLLGEMTNLHARLAFDGRVRSQMQRMWREAQVENRLLGAGAVAAVVLLLLGTIFGYLKLDTLTRGYYTRRLQFATAAVILATVAAAGAAAHVGWPVVKLESQSKVRQSDPTVFGPREILDRPSPIEVKTGLGPAAGQERAGRRQSGPSERM